MSESVNIQQNLNGDLKPDIEAFIKSIESNKFNIYSLNLDNYKKNSEIENEIFHTYRRDINSPEIFFSTPKPSIQRAKSTPSRSESTLSNNSQSITSSMLNYTIPNDSGMKIQLTKLKRLFLSHHYEQLPKSLSHEYLKKQVEIYMQNQNDNLAYLRGYGLDLINGESILVSLTERPVNGPLSSLFLTVKTKEISNSIDKISNSSYLNLDQLTTVTSEQKFTMIVGILHGIAFIHKNNFIHSNLNPSTVYLNEDLEPVICDYIFVPQFKVVQRNSNQFTFSIEKEEAEKIFKNKKFVAPEILNGGQFGSESDIYSVGMIIRFILCDGDENDDCKLNREWDDIILKCIQKDPTKRPTAVELLETLLKDDESINKYVSSIEEKETEI